MTEFVASNGAKVEKQPNGVIVLTGGLLDPRIELSPGIASGLQEYYQHEANKKPWHEAVRGDVWLFRNESDSQRALAWRGLADWDVIDPRGNFHSKISDVTAEMEHHDFYGWDNATAELIYRIGDAS